MLLKVYLTSTQIKKYKESGELVLSKNIFAKEPNFSLHLDENVLKDVNNLKKNNKKLLIKNELSGGFLPIIPLLTGIAAISTVSKNIYDSIQNKKINDQIKAKLEGKAISLSNKKIIT